MDNELLNQVLADPEELKAAIDDPMYKRVIENAGMPPEAGEDEL